MTEQRPTIGRIVDYTLSEQDAAAISSRRQQDQAAARDVVGQRYCGQPSGGNQVSAGDVFPLIITRVWGDQPGSAVNGQVLLDGNDLLWVTSVSLGEGPRHFAWPARV